MSYKPPSAFRQAWYRWKALKLPWRKRFLVGLDLQGNTYWEFKDAITAGRMRRIVQYTPATHHSDLVITPQWHQWLRHTRYEPPSLTEQSADLARLEQLKVLARRADERWARKESYLDKPVEKRVLEEEGRLVDCAGGLGGEGGRDGIRGPVKAETKSAAQEQTKEKDPWKVARGGPSEGWQPTAWGGEVAPRRR